MKEKLLKILEKMTDEEFWVWVKTWNDKIRDRKMIMDRVNGWHEVIVERELDKLENK